MKNISNNKSTDLINNNNNSDYIKININDNNNYDKIPYLNKTDNFKERSNKFIFYLNNILNNIDISDSSNNFEVKNF
jgi:hypothetical protein